MIVDTFSKSLKDNIKPLVDRVNNKFASSVIIDGGLGQGKTTLAVEMADYINSLYGKGLVDLKNILHAFLSQF
jgi:Flp pilus assembly CpaF family ATPase